MEECIFCRIAAGAIPSDTVYEDEDVRVFKDIHPKAPVHLLAVPKIHIPSVAHLTDSQEMVMGKTILAASKAAEHEGLAGYKLVINVGKDGGQVVDHIHVHVLGGWKNPAERSMNV